MATVPGVGARSRHISGKVRAGIRRFGVGPTAAGAARLAWLQLRRPDESRVRVARGVDRPLEFRFAVPRQVMPTLVLFQAFTEPEFALLSRVLRPESTFVDVGGGIGTYAVTAATLVDGPVHVFEPTVENAETIRRNARLNRVADRIEVHEVALSDTAGFSTIVSGHNTFTNNVGAIEDAPPDDAEGSVAVTTLDEFCERNGIDHVDVLKIDVAGYEPMVIGGARRLLAEGRVDLLTLELSLRFLDTFEVLEGHGYQLCYCDDGVLTPVSSLEPDVLLAERPSTFTVNVVAVSPAARARLEAEGVLR